MFLWQINLSAANSALLPAFKSSAHEDGGVTMNCYYCCCGKTLVSSRTKDWPGGFSPDMWSTVTCGGCISSDMWGTNFSPVEEGEGRTGQRWYCQLVGAEAGWTPVDGSFSLEACGWPPGGMKRV